MPLLEPSEKAAYDAHVAILAGNPHGLTRAMIGAADAAATRTTHSPLITPAFGSKIPGQIPTPVAVGVVPGLQFSLSDFAYRIFKIPSSYVGSPTVHIHWTKSDDSDESNKDVLWRLSYLVFDGSSNDVNVAPTVLDIEDTYTDAGTTSRIVHRSNDGALVGLVASKYLAIRVGRAAPVGPALAADPILFSVDLLMVENLNV